MNYTKLIFLIFIILECSNLFILYFKPDSKKANGLGIFKAFEQSKLHPEIHQFVRYLIFWIAGAKLIFIMLCIAILIWGQPLLQFWSTLVMAISISSFYWRLYPLIGQMDQQNQLTIKGYSKMLFYMILVIILLFVSSFIEQLI